MNYEVGSLVRTRGREWVVLPESDVDLLVLRPLGGTDLEIAGVLPELEEVSAAQFSPPDPTLLGDHRSCRLLRESVRLGFRSSSGPFRSFGQIACEPRPYQLVPLLMGLKLDPVRLLIADDVGIGKTIEACLVAKELLARGEVERLTVLCPPHLAEQWRKELAEKFHIEAELVLASTAARLERQCTVGQSLFDLHPYTVVSMDYIKSDRRREEFLRACPPLVIVDEAHTCARGQERRGGRHQRHELVARLTADTNRHVILVTATPHSGKEDAFRSLLTFLGTDFEHLPEDLSGVQNEELRRQLAAHFVQRRRVDIREYLDATTVFPDREEGEETYELSPEYRRLFDKVLAYARETVLDPEGHALRRRVRWWSALALLRALASSPAAAASTLRTRARVADSESLSEADEIGREMVFDLDPVDAVEDFDVSPGADAYADDEEAVRNRRRLLELAREADELRGGDDAKLERAVLIVDQLVKEGFHPIVFCRFIDTSDYVAEEFRKRLSTSPDLISVTGTLPPAEREARVATLGGSERRVLVCTDCLSEGINLQDHFDAVVHYDLSWNPTRHEQREGRVDRYGQEKPTVRVLTYYGTDNQIDGIVLDVLIRKHKTIRNSLGYSVPVPADTNAVMEAVFEGLLLRERVSSAEQYLPGFEEFFKPTRDKLFTEWEDAADKEKLSRTMFAQRLIKVEEVAREMEAARDAVGSPEDTRWFVESASEAQNGVVDRRERTSKFDLRETPRALKESIGGREEFEAGFELPLPESVLHLTRTHPVVEGFASYVADTALDEQSDGIARRAGVIRTSAVERRSTLLLVRYRFHIVAQRGGVIRPMLAEECGLLAFSGSPDAPDWLDEAAAEDLLRATPSANVGSEQAQEFIKEVVDRHDALSTYLEADAERRAQELLEAHERVREAARIHGTQYSVEPQLPVDILGIYVFLPAAGASK